MLLTEKNFDIWYKEYQTQYDRTKKYVKARGGQIRDINPMTRRDFKTNFIGAHADNPQLTAKKLAQKMAKEELYEISWKQAEAAATHLGEELGIPRANASMISKIRMSPTTFWDLVKETRVELKGLGYRGKALAFEIGHRFFGSV